jgi:hypothetical protein
MLAIRAAAKIDVNIREEAVAEVASVMAVECRLSATIPPWTHRTPLFKNLTKTWYGWTAK